MGFWSVMTSVDLLDENCNYEVALDPAAALSAAEAAVYEQDRVLVRRPEADNADGLTVEALTVNHTSGWAFMPPFVWLLFIRSDRLATITAAATPTGSTIQARGTLDTASAQRLRALRAA